MSSNDSVLLCSKRIYNLFFWAFSQFWGWRRHYGFLQNAGVDLKTGCRDAFFSSTITRRRNWGAICAWFGQSWRLNCWLGHHRPYNLTKHTLQGYTRKNFQLITTHKRIFCHLFIVPETRMAEVGSHSSRAKMAIRIFVKQVFTIFAINASFLLVNANLQI